MNVGLFVCANDCRKFEFEHGMHSVLLVVLPPELRISLLVVAQAGFAIPVNEETGPTEVSPT
ncbi:hypothetical protein AWZ68_07290 [Shigella sonnei]|nr:hypothetical protein AVR74_26095 [Escherichia coli]KWW04265.1 hypothetical protein VP22_0219495 [Escherichia fergusonii]OCC56249.1 hypothetical protein AWZ66_01635 [Shigella sonnei]KWW04270.1 hypothetical protein VP22_0219520 [Escherichia fergusonii]KYR40076.1 hypothetical protein AML05_15325 [Escherichia coli]